MNHKVNARAFRDTTAKTLMDLGNCNQVTDFGGQSVCITHDAEIFEGLCLAMTEIANRSLAAAIKEIKSSSVNREFSGFTLSLDTTEEEELKFEKFVELVDTPLSSTAKLDALAKRSSPFA